MNNDSIIVVHSAMNGTSEEQKATKRSECECVQKQIANTIVVFQIQIPSSQKPIPVADKSKSDSHRLRLQSTTESRRSQLRLRSKSIIQVRMPTAIVRICRLTILSLQLCGCRGRNKRKRIVSVSLRTIAVSNRASNVQITSACFVAAYLAIFTS